MSMINLSHSNAIFTGGSYTQVNHNIQQKKSSWDLLQSAASPSAFHDSGDTFDAPRCHPNTRVAIMNELRDFALRRGDTGRTKILWLNGGAGAGKSAISRSLCEESSGTNSLLASFFFNRSDASRNHHKSFVATITYQIYGSIPPHYQSLILAVIDRDPFVLTRSIDAQFMALIVGPLHDLFEQRYFDGIGKWLIVLDGLDECSPTAAQINILTAIQKISTRPNIPFIFLIASRPENALQSFFSSSMMVPLLYRLNLSDSYAADEDIERFLREKLQEILESHPFKDSIPSEWPLDESIEILVDKSSSQFLYASLVVKYVTSNRHHPPRRLEVVLNLRPAKGNLPFAELDRLYMQILSSAEGDIDLALRLIGYSNEANWLKFEDLVRICHLDFEDCLATFCDLWAVMSLESNHPGHQLRVLHKSFSDFLYDSSRSDKFCVSKTRLFIELGRKCLLYISEVTYTPESSDAHKSAVSFLNAFSTELVSNIGLIHHDLMTFSIMSCYKTFSSPTGRSKEETRQFFITLWDFFFGVLLAHLYTLAKTDYSYLYDHHLSEFQNLITQHPDVYTTLLTDPKLDYYPAWATVIITGLILTGQFGSEAPLKIFTLACFDYLTKEDSGSVWGDVSWFWEELPTQRLVHDAALRCFSFLEHDANSMSIAATLRYLSWALFCAAYSPELDQACRTCTRDLLSTLRKGCNSSALSNVAQDVLSAMRDHVYSKHTDTGDVETSETSLPDNGD